MTPSETIINTLTSGFVKFDDLVLVDTIEWFKAAYLRLQEVKDSFPQRKNQQAILAYYAKAFDVCGGKGNYGLLRDYGCGDRLVEQLKKSHDFKILKRNTKIAKKLIDADITEITETEIAYTKNGFDGYFLVRTNLGTKRVCVNTIIAGGYNIQCTHYRVLVTIK